MVVDFGDMGRWLFLEYSLKVGHICKLKCRYTLRFVNLHAFHDDLL